MAYHALKNRADAEDVMQTTLLRLLEQELALPEGTWEDHVEAFFWMVLRHRNHGILVMTQRAEAAALLLAQARRPPG